MTYTETVAVIFGAIIYTIVVFLLTVWVLREGLRPTQRATQAQTRELVKVREEIGAMRQTIADVGVAMHGAISRNVQSRTKPSSPPPSVTS